MFLRLSVGVENVFAGTINGVRHILMFQTSTGLSAAKDANVTGPLVKLIADGGIQLFCVFWSQWKNNTAEVQCKALKRAIAANINTRTDLTPAQIAHINRGIYVALIPPTNGVPQLSAAICRTVYAGEFKQARSPDDPPTIDELMTLTIRMGWVQAGNADTLDYDEDHAIYSFLKLSSDFGYTFFHQFLESLSNSGVKVQPLDLNIRPGSIALERKSNHG